MNTREFIRIQLAATPDAVHAWLESAAAFAEKIGERVYCVASLEIGASSTDSVSPADSAHSVDTMHRRRYGIFNGDGIQVLNADLHCPVAGTTVLELRRDNAFPLVVEELMTQLDDRFHGAGGEVLAETHHIRAGAPPLACNVWLENQLRQLPNPTHFGHLYAAWLAHYVTLRGYEPLDPRRSFRAAVHGCLKRMRARSVA